MIRMSESYMFNIAINVCVRVQKKKKIKEDATKFPDNCKHPVRSKVSKS